jgi:acyl carrier protein
MVHSLVRKHALDVLQWSQSTPVDGDLPLADIGFDSLMSLELRDVLARELDIPLPATLLFDHPTLNELSAFLASEAPAGGRVH